MGPKSRNQKRERVEEQPPIDNETHCHDGSKTSCQESTEKEDMLHREGENLSGVALRNFLQKNFLDFADDECARISSIDEACSSL